MKNSLPQDGRPERHYAIIEFDPLRIAQINAEAESRAICWIIQKALTGQDYPKERGIRRITHITRPRGMALDGGPPIYIFRVADPSGDAP